MASSQRIYSGCFFVFTFFFCSTHVHCTFLNHEVSHKYNNTSELLPVNFAPCDFSNPARIAWRAEQARGLLYVALKQFPSVCNVSQVGVQLSTNTCNTNSYKIHTPRRYFNPEKSKDNPCNRDRVILNLSNSLANASEDEIVFTLRHIYSGRYCLEVFLSRQRPEESKTHMFDLNFINDKRVVYPYEWNTTINVIHKSPKELVIRFAVPDAEYQFSQFLVQVLWIYSTCFTSHSTWNDQIPRRTWCLKPHVSESLGQVESHFPELPDGNFCVLITPMDERCNNQATYWQNSSHSSCTRYYPRTIHIDHKSWTPLKIEPVCCGPEDYVLIGIGSFFALCTLITAFVLLRRIRNIKPLCGEQAIKPLSKEPALEKANKRPELPVAPVVLFYGVKDKKICEKVQKLKQVLTSIGFCKVYDYRDDALYDLLATHGPMWISTLLARPEIKVVVVTSAEAVEAQQELLRLGTNVGGATAETNDDPLGQMYLQGLRDLMILGQKEGGYQRIFCVRFPEFTDSDVALSFVTPFVCFLLPGHTQQLLNHIHSLQVLKFPPPVTVLLRFVCTVLSSRVWRHFGDRVSRPESERAGRALPAAPTLAAAGKQAQATVVTGITQSPHA